MSNMQPAGWYPAEGDPPGTHRYWDGTQWQGGPELIGGMSVTSSPQIEQIRDETLRSVAIVLTVLKGIGAILAFVLLLAAAALADSLEEAIREAGGGDVDLQGLTAVLWVVAFVYAAVAGGLLWGHLSGALRDDYGRLFVFAVILSVLDLLAVLSALSDPSIFTALMLVMLPAQVWVAYRARTFKAVR